MSRARKFRSAVIPRGMRLGHGARAVSIWCELTDGPDTGREVMLYLDPDQVTELHERLGRFLASREGR